MIVYIYIAYDYRMIIIFREYDIYIYILNIKYTLIVCLEPGRGIDGHAYWLKNKSASYKYRYRGPVWVDDIDPIWITVAPKGSPQRLRALMEGHDLVQ